MVATESNRLPSFKNRPALSPRENEPRERKSNPEQELSSDREPSANSGLETKIFSATGRRRSFLVDIPLYRTRLAQNEKGVTPVTDLGGDDE